MVNLKTDSPVSRRIVLSFLDFLQSVEPLPGADLEGLEVVKECLEDVFNLNSTSFDDQRQPDLLVKYFSSLGANKISGSNTDHASTFSDTPSTSSTQGAAASSSHISKPKDGDFSGEPNTTGVSKDELFGQFFAALEKIHFFNTASAGVDDSWLLDRATNLFHEAVAELERSGCQTINSSNLAEAFKSQGNRDMQSKLYTDALERYTFAIALCPSNSVYYCNRAAACTQIHKYMEAIEDCKTSIEIDPNYSKAYSRLGLAYYAQGNYREAIDKGFRKALQLDPDNNSVKENIRVAEQKLRDLHGTEQHPSQWSTNGQARGGPSNQMNASFNPADLSSDIVNMFMNIVGQHPQERTNGDSDTGRSDDEPGLSIGGNISVNIGEDAPEELVGTLRSMMAMFSGAQPHQNPQGPTPN